jgi:hypothetical protein
MATTCTPPETVVVRSFMGRSVTRWLIGTVGHLAQITDAAGAAKVRAGIQPERVLGFPLSDVFRPTDVSISDGDSPNWEEMTPRF